MRCRKKIVLAYGLFIADRIWDLEATLPSSRLGHKESRYEVGLASLNDGSESHCRKGATKIRSAMA